MKLHSTPQLVHEMNGAENEWSMEHLFLGTKVPGNE